MSVIGFKKARCMDCYKCVRLCPVKAIRIKNEHASFVAKDCILCGKCLDSCPQGAILTYGDLRKVKPILQTDGEIAAIISSAYLGLFDEEMTRVFIDGLYQLGFTQVHMIAEGASITLDAYEALLEDGRMDNVMTSFCPVVNQLIEKYHPDMIPYMAPVIPPVIAKARLLRQSGTDNLKIISITSCLSEGAEAVKDERTAGAIDNVITFSEIIEMMSGQGIDIGFIDRYDSGKVIKPARADAYAAGAGIAKVIGEKTSGYAKLAVEGIKQCINVFEGIRNGEIRHCFIELSACPGGCINGPASGMKKRSAFSSQLFVQNIEMKAEELLKPVPEISLSKEFRNLKEAVKMPSEQDIRKILSQIGKDIPEQELNCGACGHPTCRDKAIASFQNKSPLMLCIPYMYEQAKSLSDVILSVTPNMIMIVDEQLRVRAFNNAAEVVFGLPEEEAIRKQIDEIMDAVHFKEVFDSKRSLMNIKVEYPQYHLITMQNIIYVRKQKIAIGIFRDVTLEEKELERRYKLKMKAVEAAQKVIDKQMLIAQEIAGLLGETTAETKVTLTTLRDSFMYDGDEPR